MSRLSQSSIARVSLAAKNAPKSRTLIHFIFFVVFAHKSRSQKAFTICLTVSVSVSASAICAPHSIAIQFWIRIRFLFLFLFDCSTVATAASGLAL